MKALKKIISNLFYEFSDKNQKTMNWQDLILRTGEVDNISELTEYQLKYLEKIKINFKLVEHKALIKAQKMLNEFYNDENPTKEIGICGLNLPEDNSETWELFFESYGEDKYMVPIIIFQDFEIIGDSLIH